MSRPNVERALYDRVRVEQAAIAQFYFVTHNRVWADSNVFAQFRGRRNYGAGINLAHRVHLSGLLDGHGNCAGRRHIGVHVHHLAHHRSFSGEFTVHSGAPFELAESPAAGMNC